MRLARPHALVLFALIATSSRSLTAQDLGRGNVGFDGFEPHLSVATTSEVASLRASKLTTDPSARTYVLVATAPGRTRVGTRGIVLGLDLASTVVVGPLPVSSVGDLDVSFFVAPQVRGLPLFFQVLQVDPRVGDGLVASDSKSMVLGNVTPELVLVRPGTSSGLVDLERRLDDGKPGTAVLFRDLTLLDLELTSLDETRTYRDDLPRNPVVAGTRVLELPDGSRVVRYRDGVRKKSGLLRAHDGGRLEVLFEGELCEVKCCILASTTHLAFATDSHRLYLYRLDESNWPGRAEPILDITPPANEIDFLESSLVFGERVLAFVDEHRGLFLAPLDGSVPFAPVLPPSGGRAPEFFDSEVAVSGDGRTFAFGAGRDRDLKDVYVVRDDGVAVNITKKPTIYADVGYSNPGRRVELALDHDGSLVSWVDRTIKDDANYVSPVEFPAPVLITGDPMFKCIDIGTTSRFPPKGGLLIVAGQGNAMLDLFFSPLMKKEDVVPLTKTASSNVPPYASDSKLDLFDIATYRGGDQYMTWAHHEQGFDGLWVVDTVHEDARLVAKSHAGFGMSSSDARTLVVDDGNAFVVFDPRSRSSSFATRVALGSSKVTAAVPARDRTAMFAIAGTREVWAFDLASAKTEQLVKDAEVLDLSAAATSSACLVLTGSNGVVEFAVAKRGAGVTRLATGAWTAFLR